VKVTVQPIKQYVFHFLLYGLKACALHFTINSLNFIRDRTFVKFFYTRSQEVVDTYLEMLKCNGGRSNSGKHLVISTILYTVSDIRC